MKLWNDTSTAEECALIEACLGGADRVVELAGNPVLPGYTASKVLWFKRQHPALYARMRTILLPHDYLNFYLTGCYSMEAGDASGTGFFDVRRRCWSAPILAAIDPERDLMRLLPPLLSPTDPAGRLQASAAAALGLNAGIVVAAGGGDNMMGAIGTGAVVPGRLTISLGTSGTLYAFSPEPVVSETQGFAAFCASSGGYLPLLCTMNCTSATEIMRELLQAPLADFDNLLRASAPGAGGITALPFFNGERTPNVPQGEACLFGLTAANAHRPHLLRAVVEATVFGLKTGLAAMRANGLAASEACLIGGGAASSVWAQIVADTLGLVVTRPPQQEAAAFGAALQALWCYQYHTSGPISIGELTATHLEAEAGLAVHAEAAAVATYRDVYARYERLVPLVKELYS